MKRIQIIAGAAVISAIGLGLAASADGGAERSRIIRGLELPAKNSAATGKTALQSNPESGFPMPRPLAKKNAEWKGKTGKTASSVPEIELIASILEDSKSTTYGLYSIPSTGGDFSRVTYGPYAKNGGVYQDGYYFYSFADSYYGMNVYYSFLLDGNQSTWPQAAGGEQNDARLCATAMANNPVNNRAYGCFMTANGNSHELGELDIHNFTRTTIAPLSQTWSAAGFTADGTLYALLTDGNLATVDLTTGATTTIGQTGLPVSGPTSGTIDYRTGIFYYATNAPGDHAIYTIDLATASPTKLFDIPYDAQLGGMFIKYPQIEAGAPGAVTDMTVDFPGGALGGNISFTAPSETFDGMPLSGSLSYDIAVGGNSIASGNCQAGSRTTAPLTLNAPGEYAFSVTVSNAAGSSDPVKLTRWIGPDSPKAPQNVSMTLDGMQVSLEWDAVTEGVHGGWLVPSEVTYTIKRYPGGTVVSENQAGTTFSETVANTGSVISLYYEVTAKANDLVSAVATSNVESTGRIEPPYSETFDNAASLSNFTIIDANCDGNTWSFNYDKVQAKFNTQMAMDDWLITAPIYLESGYTYDLSFDVRCHLSTYPERLEVMLGTAPEVSAMTTTLLEPFTIGEPTYTRYTARVSVGTTGEWHIGFHGISEKDKYYMYLDNIALSAPYGGAIPGLVSDFTVTPDYDGRTRATIAFKAPTTTTEGEPLEGEMRIDVSRNDQIVHTFGGIAPGETCRFEDTASEIGMYRYTVIATNDCGSGPVFAETARIGVNMAPAPLNLAISESEEGKVHITWEAPQTDIQGYPLNPAAIRYAVLDKSGQNVLAENLAATQFDFQVLEPGSGRQTMVFYYVLSQTAAGANFEDYSYTSQVSVGSSYGYPYSESFQGGKITGVWGIRREAGECSWGVGPSSQQPAAMPQDGDGGLAAFMPTAPGDCAILYSGKISIPAAAKAPAISFWYFGVPNFADKLDVLVGDANADSFQTLDSFEISAGGAGWHRRIVPLDSWKGKTIQIGFMGTAVSAETLLVIDNIRLTDVIDSNVSLANFEAPQRATAGTDAIFSAEVVNNGLTEAQDVLLSITMDGETAYTERLQPLAPDSGRKTTFSIPLSVFGADRRVVSASVEWAPDMEGSDNELGPYTIKVSSPGLPRVTDLAGEPAPDGVMLRWSAPTFGDSGEEMLESMENAEPFAINSLEGWSFHDGDGQTTYGIEGVTFPNNGEKMAFIIMDSTYPGLSEFPARSGKQSLACFSCDSGVQNDDWAISPLLSGRPQTITFSARAQTTAYGYEAFEFLYSTSGTSPEDFVKAGEDLRVGSQWKEYSFDVPQGAVRFALRCVSKDAFALLIDDILFTPAPLPEFAEPWSYRVYCDGEVSGGTSADRHEYKETLFDVHTYHVTALYPQGESGLSNPFTSDFSSVDGLGEMSDPIVYARGEEIFVRHAKGKEIRVMDSLGLTVYKASQGCDGSVGFFPTGIYLVSVGQKVFKVMVE